MELTTTQKRQRLLTMIFGAIAIFFTGYPHVWSIYQPYVMEPVSYTHLDVYKRQRCRILRYEFFVCIKHCNSSPLWYLVLSCRNCRTDRLGRLCRMHHLLCLWKTWHERGEKDHDYESDRRPMWNDDHHT